jgi:hypothetical protein
MKRGVPNKQNLPRLTVEGVLRWAAAYHARWGRWPTCQAGPVLGAPFENWQGVDMALRQGLRGLPSGSSLAQPAGPAQKNARPPRAAGRPGLISAQQRTWGVGARHEKRPFSDAGHPEGISAVRVSSFDGFSGGKGEAPRRAERPCHPPRRMAGLKGPSVLRRTAIGGGYSTTGRAGQPKKKPRGNTPRGRFYPVPVGRQNDRHQPW